jgi:hypothetical protein
MGLGVDVGKEGGILDCAIEGKLNKFNLGQGWMSWKSLCYLFGLRY